MAPTTFEISPEYIVSNRGTLVAFTIDYLIRAYVH